MDCEVNDIILNRVKEALNTGKIKLWLPPYFNKDVTDSEELKKLAASLSESLSIPQDEIVQNLTMLQQKAIDNLSEREAYHTTGLASLKLRPPQKIGKLFSIKIKLKENGAALKEMVAQHLNVSSTNLKMICKGHVIRDKDALEGQGVKHGSQIMLLILTNSEEEITAVENSYAVLDDTKRSLNLLADNHTSEGEAFLQIADQSGKLLKLPEAEERALVLAMTLHEKGRHSLKNGRFDLALVLLLEAEKEFSQCHSSLLERVDNYGLLSLDLAWCYLNLQSLSQLPDAQRRLESCEQVFHKSYGVNLERLVAVKGSSGNEHALFLRLHLLQAVVLYHQGKTEQAKALFNKVELELKDLKVDDDKLGQLAQLGYTVGQSRMALRESKGDVEIAVTIIENREAERKKIKELEEEEKKLKKHREKLGKCLDGHWVEPEFHKALVDMGYSDETASWALAQSNNKIADAIELIQLHPERLPPLPVADDAVAQLVDLGFEEKMAIAALRLARGNLEKAVDELVINNGVLHNVEDDGPSTSRLEKKKRKVDKAAAEDAYKRVTEGISNIEDDYLDLDLVAEEAYLKQYQKFISK